MIQFASLFSLLLQASTVLAEPPKPSCDSCATWNETQPPFRICGNAYCVGVRGLSSVLITGGARHAFIDRAACKKYLEEARGRVQKRVADESAH